MAGRALIQRPPQAENLDRLLPLQMGQHICMGEEKAARVKRDRR